MNAALTLVVNNPVPVLCVFGMIGLAAFLVLCGVSFVIDSASKTICPRCKCERYNDRSDPWI